MNLKERNKRLKERKKISKIFILLWKWEKRILQPWKKSNKKRNE